MNIEIDTRKVQKMLKNSVKSIRYATMNSVNDVAFEVLKDTKEMFKREIDNPTSYTLNSLAVKKATLKTQTATFGFKNSAQRSAANYLHNLIFLSKNRSLRAFEKRITDNKSYFITTDKARTNKNGNISAQQINQIIQSIASVSKDAKYIRITKQKKYRRNKNIEFEGYGIYEFKRNKYVLILKEVERVKYSRKLPYFEQITKTYKYNINKILEKNIEKELQRNEGVK